MKGFLRGRVAWLTVAALAVVMSGRQAPVAAADYTRYHTYGEMSAALRELAKAHPNLAKLVDVARTRDGRTVWAIEIANPAGTPVAGRPALLVAANFEGDQVIGSEIALFVAESLLTGYASNPTIKQRLDHSAFYINNFLMEHPNIAGVQSYHNAGGMILRGPGAEWQGEYPRADVTVYDELGRQGERMLPYYRYLVIWSGLYTVHGGFIDWTNDGLGMLSFSNELWNGNQYFNSPELQTQQQQPNSPINNRVAQYFFDDKLEFGDQYVDWKPFDHPQFGKIEMGGWKKTVGRVPPRFMNEELCHRNMAFSLYQADEMPQMKSGETTVEAIGGGVYRVRADFSNVKLTPTILAKAAENNVVRPDLLTAEGSGVQILSAGWVANKFRPGATELIDQKRLERILVRNGHPGRATRTIEYLVRGAGEMTVTYDSLKGGRAATKIAVK